MAEMYNQFLQIYLKYRYQNQRSWYESREKEYRAANEQVITWKAILIGLTTLVSTLAATRVFGLQNIWSILAVLLPALSTALAAYDGLYAFSRHAKLYHDAALQLQRARGKAPDIQSGITSDEFSRQVAQFVEESENILRLEQGQWGQLVSQIEPVEPPSNE
jgi:hypothetical protein